jgi:alcohol dehydrogenase class IV
MSVFLNDYTEIAEILKKHGAKRPFVCCGKSFQKTAIFAYLKQFNIVVYDNIRPNPRYEDMITGAEVFKRGGCDFMIAAGGGSPMDSAKMIRLMATNDIDRALSEPMENNSYPALFIPTTSGTGSEATKTSVFYLNDTEKFSVHNYDFIPDYVLFDEGLLETVPDYQRKATCLDALCHSIESFWCTKANDESREYAKKSIRLFFEHKESYMKNEREGNRGMLMSSFYGGKAINITGTTAPHAMCYTITMNCNTAHGHSVAVVLAKMWEYMLEGEYPKETLTELSRIMGGKTPEDGAGIFSSLLDEFQLEYPRADESELDFYTSKVNTEKLKTNPIPLDSVAVKEIYRRILCE